MLHAGQHPSLLGSERTGGRRRADWKCTLCQVWRALHMGGALLLELVGVYSGCVQWACTVGVYSGCVQWVCIVGVYSGRVQWVCTVGVYSGCVQWACTVGVYSGRVQWVCTVGVYSGRVQWACTVGVYSGRVQWACTVGVYSGCVQWVCTMACVLPHSTWALVNSKSILCVCVVALCTVAHIRITVVITSAESSRLEYSEIIC